MKAGDDAGNDADRHLAEAFARRVVETFGEQCLAAVCLPWSAGLPPAGIIIPTSEEGTLDSAQVEHAVAGKSIIVVCCTFEDQEEKVAATRLVEQILQFQSKCILAAHLLSPGVDHYTPKNYLQLMQVHQAIWNLGVDDVMLDPEWEPSRLKLRLQMARYSWSVNQERLDAMLAEEPQLPEPGEVEALEATRHRLLWEDITPVLMPHFHALASETDNFAGGYAISVKIESPSGMVWEGRDKDNREVVVKIVNKADVFTPGEVEGIYREFRFLSGLVKHPNIVVALDCFHGPTKVYTILEHVGKQHLGQYLADFPGLRMNEDDAIKCFHQLASAIACCHEQNISHRCVSPEHVVMSVDDSGVRIPKLVDFRSAMIAKLGVNSVTFCGTLPCVAPEVLTGDSYWPKACDHYSLGVLFLEMAGGMGSLLRAVQIDAKLAGCPSGELTDRVALAEQILRYFQTPGNHRAALSCMAGVENSEILEALVSLIQPEESRSTLEEFLPAEEAAAEDEAGDAQPSIPAL